MIRLLSGGQTGADRAALDVALKLGIPYGGWVPKGGWAEDAPLSPGVLDKYPQMRETETSDPAERTRLNVRHSQATLILVNGPEGTTSPGTLLTEQTAEQLGRPFLVVRLDEPGARCLVGDWLRSMSKVQVLELNIAGPRESEAPGTYAQSRELLEAVLSSYLREGPS
jgi:hypothetical protein